LLQRALTEVQLAPMIKLRYLSHVQLLLAPQQAVSTHKGDRNEGV
jgi:hypothetical protein